jgi:hypothetical protein
VEDLEDLGQTVLMKEKKKMTRTNAIVQRKMKKKSLKKTPQIMEYYDARGEDYILNPDEWTGWMRYNEGFLAELYTFSEE